MKRLAVLITLFLVLGCARTHMTITNLPPGVTQTEATSWYQAVGISDFISQRLKDATDFTINLHGNVLPNGNPAIEQEYYIKILTGFAQASKVGKHLDSLLKGSPQTFNQGIKDQIASDLRQLSAELKQANSDGTTAIKDPNKVKEFNTVIDTLNSNVQALISLAGASNGVYKSK